MMGLTCGEVFSAAQEHYDYAKTSGKYIGSPDFARIPMLYSGLKLVIVVARGLIREIEIHYDCGSVQTIRPDKN